MKKLSELYANYPHIMIKDIKINSKEVEKNDIFVCVSGVNKDRNDFIDEAIENGASAIVTNKNIIKSVPVVYVDNPNTELVRLAKKFYDYPDSKLTLIATTGTNGKTTVATIIQELLGNDICGYIGTNGVAFENFEEKLRNTTPDADKLYKYFDKFVQNNCRYASIEASSEAFLRNRLRDLKFKVGIVTNVTEDHLNVHKTITNYIESKKELVKNVRSDGFSILNIDDKYYTDFLSVAKGKVLTYGKNKSDLQILKIDEYIDKTDILVKYKEKKYSFTSPLLGEFNAYNLCAALLSLLALNFDLDYLLARVKNLTVPKGRFEVLDFNNYKVILDYAHTTDALEKVYKFLNKVKKGRIITVTGSAGGREKEKRKDMGKVVLDNSDYVIFTMDDPRYEDPNKIIDDLVSASEKTNYERIIDRKEAIRKALSIAKENDFVLIAGKGRDNYMAIEDKYLDYNDYDVILDYFKEK